MVKIRKISEIEPCLGFTEFDMLKKYRQSSISFLGSGSTNVFEVLFLWVVKVIFLPKVK